MEEKEANEECTQQMNEITERSDKALRNVLCEHKMKLHYTKKSQDGVIVSAILQMQKSD